MEQRPMTMTSRRIEGIWPTPGIKTAGRWRTVISAASSRILSTRISSSKSRWAQSAIEPKSFLARAMRSLFVPGAFSFGRSMNTRAGNSRLDWIRAELGSGLARKRRIDHIPDIDRPGEPAPALEETEILANAIGRERAVRIERRRVDLRHQVRREPEVGGDDIGDLARLGADKLAVGQGVVIGANTAQVGLHEPERRIGARGGEAVAVEYGGDLIVGIERLRIHEAHAVALVGGDGGGGLDQDRCVDRLVLEGNDLHRKRHVDRFDLLERKARELRHLVGD